MATVLNGKKLADEICLENLKPRVDVLKKFGVEPKLTIVTSGKNAANQVYVRNKLRRCEQLGIACNIKHYDRLDAVSAMMELDSTLNGPTIVQLPIEGNISTAFIEAHLDPHRDVDGFSIENIYRVASGKIPYFAPCTPQGIMRLLAKNNITVEGKQVCIIGRSNIVGRPLSWMMEQSGATVTLCHSKTPEAVMYHSVKHSDIVVSATGVKGIITLAKMEEYGADVNIGLQTFIDVGINVGDNGKMCGDFDPAIFDHCQCYTPVPGGVGPMTVAMLMENVVEYYEG